MSFLSGSIMALKRLAMCMARSPRALLTLTVCAAILGYGLRAVYAQQPVPCWNVAYSSISLSVSADSGNCPMVPCGAGYCCVKYFTYWTIACNAAGGNTSCGYCVGVGEWYTADGNTWTQIAEKWPAGGVLNCQGNLYDGSNNWLGCEPVTSGLYNYGQANLYNVPCSSVTKDTVPVKASQKYYQVGC